MTEVDRRTLLAAGLAAGAAPAVGGTARPVAWPPAGTTPLWPGPPPGAPNTLPTPRPEIRGAPGRPELQLRGVDRPTLTAFRPATPNGVGLLVCPGGGYEFLAVENEGLRVAATFTAIGYTVFLLAYRLPGEGWARRADVPLQDAQRAMRTVRAAAARYRIDPGRIGVLGFSAGGHLAASLATAYDQPVHAPVDAVDRLSARPDFVGLLYPVTTLELPGTHRGSRDELLGPEPPPALVSRRSPVLHVTSATPPSFVVHALDDDVVPPSCSREWVDAAVSRGVPVEAHFIGAGGHGFGVGLPVASEGAAWAASFDRWQKRRAPSIASA